MNSSARWRRYGAVLLSGGLLAGMTALAAGPAKADAEKPGPGLSAFVNGVEAHVHAVNAPDPKVANVNEAYNVSAVNSAGLTTNLVSEVNDEIAPQAGKNAYARGGGADVGLGSSSPANVNTEPIQLSTAESKAPTANPPYTDGLAVKPPTSNGNVQTIDLNNALDPLANASALGGRSAALWNPNFLFPTLGNTLTYAFGQAANAQLINQGGTNPITGFLNPVLALETPGGTPNQTVASTFSYTYLINNGDGTCGLGSEIHMHIAPVNINLVGATIEVGGDWVMQAHATGKSTGNFLKYGPDQELKTGVLHVVDNTTGGVTHVIDLQDLLGDTGLAEQLDPLDPLLDASVGADARAIAAPGTVPNDTSKPTVSGTHISAAADVVRLKALSALLPTDIADARVGHFEMDLKVPDGGVNCQIPVSKTTDHQIANTGQSLGFDINVPSDPNAVKPFPCDLTNVQITDVLQVEQADNPSKPPKMNIVSAKGPHNEVGTVAKDGQSVSFANIGTWKPGDPPLVIHINATVPSDSGTGRMRDTATATATPANCSASKSILGDVLNLITGGTAQGLGTFLGSNGVGLLGGVKGDGPAQVKGFDLLAGQRVQKAAVLAVTGRNDGIYLAIALMAMGSAFGLTRLRRRYSAGH